MNTVAETPPTLDIVLKDLNEGQRELDPRKMCQFTLTVPETEVPKLHAFMQSDSWEKAQAARKADLQGYLDSLEVAMGWALRHDNSGAAVFARLLASLYNGDRVKMDASKLIFTLDRENFEHAMNVIRLCRETGREPHSFFKNGNALFETIIKNWGFEKRRKS